MSHPALTAGRVAVVTGAASGIGLAVALRLARLGMKLCLADVDNNRLEQASAQVAAAAPGGATDVRAVPTDVARMEQVERLRDAAYAAFGEVALLMNNAGGGPTAGPFEHYDRWQQVLGANLWGVINGVHVFTPAMVAQGTSGVIINTGSKQGITTPPGNTAYNVAKSGVKVVTEALAHELRERSARITAHLLIPGWTFTGLTDAREKPAGAWTADQVAAMLLDGLAAGDFYILCPDNQVTRAVDEKRIQWAADDLIKNRPALSRWHPDHQAAFQAFMED